MREIISLGAKLLIITLVSGALLATTNAVTKVPIRLQEEAAAEHMRREVFPDADGFDEYETEDGTPFDAVYLVKTGGAITGAVIETTAKGFGGDIAVTVGVDLDSGVISGIRVGTHSETPGLGDKAAKEPFYGQFTGRAAQSLTVSKTASGADQIQAISAATVTSRGVTDAVNEAVAYALSLEER